jgi:hypothetical protein
VKKLSLYTQLDKLEKDRNKELEGHIDELYCRRLSRLLKKQQAALLPITNPLKLQLPSLTALAAR